MNNIDLLTRSKSWLQAHQGSILTEELIKEFIDYMNQTEHPLEHLVRIIRTSQHVNGHNEVSVQDLMIDLGWPELQLEQSLDQLKIEGLLFEPRPGVVRLL